MSNQNLRLRILAGGLALFLSCPSPLFALRPENPLDAGLEEELATALGVSAGLEEPGSRLAQRWDETRSVALRDEILEQLGGGFRDTYAAVPDRGEPPHQVGFGSLKQPEAEYAAENWERLDRIGPFSTAMRIPLVRVGFLFFMDEEMYGQVSDDLRRRLGDNVILIQDLFRNDIAKFPMSAHDYAAIAAMLQMDMRGMTVIHGGSGGAVLLMVAARLGAKVGAASLVGIDRAGGMIEFHARPDLKRNGLRDFQDSPQRADFRLLNWDLRDPEGIARQLADLEGPALIIADVGTWSGLYEITNADIMRLIPAIESVTRLRVTHFIAAGYTQDEDDFARQGISRIILGDQATLRSNYSFAPAEGRFGFFRHAQDREYALAWMAARQAAPAAQVTPVPEAATPTGKTEPLAQPSQEAGLEEPQVAVVREINGAELRETVERLLLVRQKVFTGRPAAVPNQIKGWFRSIIQDPKRGVVVVAYSGRHRIIGYAAAEVTAPGIGKISELAVLPAYRERGTGTRLFQLALQSLQQSGLVNKVFAVVLSPDSDSFGIVQRAGFTPDRTNPQQYWRDLPAVPVAEMELQWGLLHPEDQDIQNMLTQLSKAIPPASLPQVVNWFVRQRGLILGDGPSGRVVRWTRAHGGEQMSGLDAHFRSADRRQISLLIQGRFQDPWPFQDGEVRVILSRLSLGSEVPGLYPDRWGPDLQADYRAIAQNIRRVLARDGFALLDTRLKGNPQLEAALREAGLRVNSQLGPKLLLVTKRPAKDLLKRVSAEVRRLSGRATVGLEEPPAAYTAYAQQAAQQASASGNFSIQIDGQGGFVRELTVSQTGQRIVDYEREAAQDLSPVWFIGYDAGLGVFIMDDEGMVARIAPDGDQDFVFPDPRLSPEESLPIQKRVRELLGLIGMAGGVKEMRLMLSGDLPDAELQAGIVLEGMADISEGVRGGVDLGLANGPPIPAQRRISLDLAEHSRLQR